jgi:mannitol PTS system EIICBA or EIICB component
MSTFTPTVTGTGIKAQVQRVGGFLAGMVMPNIGAFIAWGVITALFIPKGWLPNATFAELVGPMITYLLPLLIGYTGGRMVHGQRGAVIGAIATIGVIVGTDVPMFLGAMIMGPLAAYLLKLVDGYVQERTRAGFEMLVDNFSLGILGAGLALLGQWAIGPVVNTFTRGAGNAVDWAVDNSLLPLASVIVEPAKVLFLNNAINHGVFTPLGAAESAESGKSILFMIETNPGPGLGILLAFLFFGPRTLRASTPAAIVIQFFGGIHEIYFPYILMKPKLILAAIAGGAAGVTTFMITDAGLVSSPAPGSIFAYLVATPRGDHVVVLLGIAVAAGVSFVVASALMGFGRSERVAEAQEHAAATEDRELAEADAEAALDAARERVAREKAASKGVPATSQSNRPATGTV